MPQMAPINWLSLFFMFCSIFIMFNILNYFSFQSHKTSMNNKINAPNLPFKNKYLTWKW